jgi:hypothetical protein
MEEKKRKHRDFTSHKKQFLLKRFIGEKKIIKKKLVPIYTVGWSDDFKKDIKKLGVSKILI